MAKRYDPIMCMMVEEPTKAQDESYIVRGRKYKVVKRDGDNVTVLGPDGKVTKMDIDFLMSEGVKTKDGTYGTVSDYYNQMKGRSKSEVERILASAEGNPNAYLAYKEWKKRYDKAKDSKAIDEAIKVCDASTGHKVVVFVENYLRSIGKNNSTGKYDKIVQGVKSLLSQSLLDDEGLKKAAEHEADRLLKKYNL